MRLIIDSNRIIAGMIKDSVARCIILSPKFEFFAPDYLLLEIRKHSEEIMRKSSLSDDDFNLILDLLLERVSIVPKSEILSHLKEAEEIIGSTDSYDVPFIALALSLENDGVWTEDRHFKKTEPYSNMGYKEPPENTVRVMKGINSIT